MELNLERCCLCISVRSLAPSSTNTDEFLGVSFAPPVSLVLRNGGDGDVVRASQDQSDSGSMHHFCHDVRFRVEWHLELRSQQEADLAGGFQCVR